MKNEQIRKYVLLLCCYMFVTLLLFFWSPVEYGVNNPIELIVLVTVYIVAFYLGAILANHTKEAVPQSHSSENRHGNKSTLNSAIVILFVFNSVAMIRNLSVVGASNILDALIKVLSDPGDAYMAKMEMESSSLFNYITILGAPIFIYAYVNGINNLKNLSKRYKVLYISCIVLEILRWLLIGTNKGLFDIVILFLFNTMISKFSSKVVPKEGRKVRMRNDRRKKILLLISLTGAVMFFFASVNSRNEIKNFHQLYGQGVVNVDRNHILFKIMPTSVAILLVRFIGYLTLGYYGLSLELTLPWKPTFLLGSNLFLSNLAYRILGIDMMSRNYLTRVENIYGYSATVKWHTMYLWLANDFSFLGVAVVMLGLGYLLSKSLKAGLYQHNPYALCISYLITMSIIYSSANNQVFGVGNLFFAFIVLLIAWKSKTRIRITWGGKA